MTVLEQLSNINEPTESFVPQYFKFPQSVFNDKYPVWQLKNKIKFIIEKNKLCSSTVYISYKAPANLGTLYRGFQLYYSCKVLKIKINRFFYKTHILVVDRSTQPDCLTGTPGMPTTPEPTTTTRQTIFDLSASNLNKVYICKGNTTTVTVPSSYNLFVLNYFYGVSSGPTCNYRYIVINSIEKLQIINVNY